MPRCAVRHQRKALGACISTLISLMAAKPLWADTTTATTLTPQTINNATATVQIEKLDTFQAEQERLKKRIAEKPAAYKDKFMQPTQLVKFAEEDEQQKVEPEGQSTYSLESRVNLFDSHTSTTHPYQLIETGIRGEYRTETRNYGDWLLQFDGRAQMLDADASSQTTARQYKDNNQRITLRNEALPLAGKTHAETTLGDQSSALTPAFGRSGRVALGSETVRGVGSKIKGEDFDLQAGYGERMSLVGGPYPAHQAQQGNIAWAGYSQTLNDKVTAGIQLNQAHDIPAQNTINQNTAASDIDSVALTLNYGKSDMLADGDKRGSVLWLKSRTQTDGIPEDTQAQGVFVEGAMQKGAYRYEVGAYQADPDLKFNANTVASDTRGAYVRATRQQVRWSASGGVDVQQDNLSERYNQSQSQRISVDTSARYQLQRNKYVGGQLRASQTERKNDAGSGSRSANGSLYYETRLKPWGDTRFIAAFKRNEALASNAKAATGEEIQWEQDWIREQYETMRPTLTTSLGIARDRSEQDTQIYPTAGVMVRHWFDPDWNVSGNLRYSSRHGNLSTSQGLSGGISTEKTLGRSWKIGASLSANEAKVESVNPLENKPLVSRSRDVMAGVYLSWSETTGKPYQRLGSNGLAGSGLLSGKVFADANKDGIQQADEVGLNGVEVVLDGGYQTTTDNRGNYSFNRVATGKHQLSLNQTSLPLPWGLKEAQQIEVSVPLRGSVIQDIATQDISH